jgi:outer membrane protein OmpA-like peptidoglycan-associated protein
MDILPGDIYINSLGIVFSDSLILTKSNSLLNIEPDIQFRNDSKLIKKRNGKEWQTIKEEFVATDDAKYIIIGCFLSDDKQVRKFKNDHPKKFRNYFYYFDNISLISNSNRFDSTAFKEIKREIYSQNSRHPVPDSLFRYPLEILKPDLPSEKHYYQTDTIVLKGDIFFEFDSYVPKKSQLIKVDSVFNNLTHDVDRVIVNGHTDSIGTDRYNQELSLQRAKSITEYILSKDYIDYENITYSGYGSSRPVVTNETEQGRYQNRRVEIIIKYERRRNP